MTTPTKTLSNVTSIIISPLGIGSAKINTAFSRDQETDPFLFNQ